MLPLAIVGLVSAAIWAFRRRREQFGPLVIVGGWFLAQPWSSATRTGSSTPTTSRPSRRPERARRDRHRRRSLATPGAEARGRRCRCSRSSSRRGCRSRCSTGAPDDAWLVPLVVAASVAAGVALALYVVLFPEWSARAGRVAAAASLSNPGLPGAPAAWSASTWKTRSAGPSPAPGRATWGRDRPGTSLAVPRASPPTMSTLRSAYVLSRVHGAHLTFHVIVSASRKRLPT